MTETDVIFLGACILKRFGTTWEGTAESAVALYEAVQRAQRDRYRGRTQIRDDLDREAEAVAGGSRATGPLT